MRTDVLVPPTSRAGDRDCVACSGQAGSLLMGTGAQLARPPTVAADSPRLLRAPGVRTQGKGRAQEKGSLPCRGEREPAMVPKGTSAQESPCGPLGKPMFLPLSSQDGQTPPPPGVHATGPPAVAHEPLVTQILATIPVTEPRFGSSFQVISCWLDTNLHFPCVAL